MKFVFLPPQTPPAGFGQRAKSTAASAVEADGLAGPHHWLLMAVKAAVRQAQRTPD